MKIDWNKEYTPAEIEALRASADYGLRQIILATWVLTAGMMVDFYVHQVFVNLLK